jgi:hypothetical protein
MQEEGGIMGFWRRVDERMWGDAKFLALSSLPPSGQSLWLYLLTGPHHDGIPGLFRIGRRGLAEALGWDQKTFDACWKEIVEAEMAVADWDRRVILIPKALAYNAPENPNTVKAWLTRLDGFPECDLVSRWYWDLVKLLRDNERESWLSNSSGNRYGNGLANGSGNRKRKRKRKREEEVPESDDPGPVALEGREEREVAKREDYEAWKQGLYEQGALHQLSGAFVDAYIEGAIESVTDHYTARNGRMTPTRLAYIARGLCKYEFDVQMAAMEFYVDGCANNGTKDERYLVAIARNFNRLGEDERERDLKKHRKRNHGRGLYAAAMN